MINSQPFFLPKYFTQKSIACFLIALFACILLFIKNALPFQWIFYGVVEVVGFFLFAHFFTKRWTNGTAQNYQKWLLWVSFILRTVWVVFSYFYFLWFTGAPFEFEAADAKGYHGEALWLVELISNEAFDTYLDYIGINYSDMGYPLYLGILYYIIGDGLLIPRLIKAFLGAYTCVLIYRIGRAHFGESAGRIAGILAMLLPNLIYYCGLHVKETEMVFFVVVFIYYTERVLRAKRLILKDVVILCFVGASLFLFRTVLAVCMICSIAVTVFLISKRVSTIGKRTGLFLLLGIVGIFIMTTPLGDVIYSYIEASDQNLSSQMDNFSTRTDGAGGGNKLSKYGSRGIFLPFMLMAPFPTLVNTGQLNTMMLAGGFFIRNIYAFFVFVAFIALYKQKLIRFHILLFSILASYLFVLASSGFALSERFHLPIVPILLIFAAYGVTQLTVKNRKYYIPYLALVTVIVVGWNWFKLAGRG